MKMSMHLITGGSGSGKTEYLCSRIIEESLAHPDRQYLVIVPEQATLQTQMLYVNRHPRKGLFNIDVLSFQRLAHRVLEETGAEERIVLRDTGKNLLLRKAAGDISEELQVFAGNFRRIGYVSEMKSLLSELDQYRIDEKKMEEILALCPERGSLYRKLLDISILQKRFRELLGETYVTGEELLERLARQVPKSALLRDSVLAFDGFTGFTPVQEVLLEELFRAAQDLYFTVEVSADADPFHDDGPYSLFHLSQEMVGVLKKLAYETHTSIEEPLIRMPETGYRFIHAPELSYLEKKLFRRGGHGEKPYVPGEGENRSISIHVNRNPMEEARFLAGEICRLVREEKLRYREIAVTVSNMDVYSDCLTAVFSERGIPFFMDHKRNALNNAAVEYVRAAVSMVEERMSYESVFRFLKSGFYPIEAQDLYLMETYVLAMEVKGFTKWEERWIRRPSTLTAEEVLRAETLRASFMEEVGTFLTNLRKRGRTVRSCTESLYELMKAQMIQERLAERADVFELSGKAVLGREYAQIFRLLMEMFDEFVSLLGDETVTLQEYRELLDAGLSELRVGVIPPGQDQVTVGDLERTRLSGVKILFCAGLNDCWLPGIGETRGILNDRDREFLAGKKIRLAPTQMEKIATQRYYLYLNLTKPSEKLCLSYCNVDMEGKTLQPTFYLREIEKLYECLPKYTETDTVLTGDPAHSEADAMRYLADGLVRNTGIKDPVWKELYSWYSKKREKGEAMISGKEQVQRLINARFLRNKEERLTAVRAGEIYGTLLSASISRLEKYAKCPFAHFLQYGLFLKEREVFGFEYLDEGNIMHEALRYLGLILEKRGTSWRDAPEVILKESCEEALEKAVAGYSRNVLSGTARRRYVVNRLEETLEITADLLQRQLQLGDFQPAEYEMNFGGSSLQVMELELDDETKLSLRGKIDRLDLAQQDGTTYVKILDYKTGDKDMDLSAVYQGLDLQLFLYLKAAQETVKSRIEKENPGGAAGSVEPAGVLYYHVLNPIINREDLKGEVDREKLIEQCMDACRPSGMVNVDGDVLALYDRKVAEEGGKSLAMPVKLKKDRTPDAHSSVMTGDEFKLMERHLIGLVKEQGKEIMSGDIKVHPVRHGDTDGCKHCSFRQICGYDETVPGYTPRKLEKLKQEDILLKLHAEDM